MAHQVFICYSGQDKKSADEVCSSLEKNGISCCKAPRDVPAGRWGSALMEAVTQSRYGADFFSQREQGAY